MEDRNNNNPDWRTSVNRFIMFIKRRIKLNRFLLVIDTKKGVSISAITLIIVDLIDLLWNLSMTFGPLNSTMSRYQLRFGRTSVTGSDTKLLTNLFL